MIIHVKMGTMINEVVIFDDTNHRTLYYGYGFDNGSEFDYEAYAEQMYIDSIEYNEHLATIAKSEYDEAVEKKRIEDEEEAEYDKHCCDEKLAKELAEWMAETNE